MIDHGLDISLLWCVLLNAMVFGSAWWFAARQITACRSQALLDAALLGYAVQYAAVGLPGIVGHLRPIVIAATALTFSVGLILLGRRSSIMMPLEQRSSNRWIFPSVVGVFTAVFLLAFVRSQATLPVISNDALTYHFPAAAQWLQHRRIDLFQTWFFNPANTYSPLVGSAFIVWLLAPFGNDIIARFVQVPALLCVGLGVYRLARQLGSGLPVASLMAAAAVLCRPIFLQSMMGKDDLFLAFFFVAALVALAPDRARENFGACRVGLAMGLLLAVKYTAFLAAPILLLAIDGPVRDGWRARRWLGAISVAVLFAGPWYLRNWWATGNPIFPLDLSIAGVHLFRGLFTAAASDAFTSFDSAASVLIGGSYGLPLLVAILLGVGWSAAALIGFRLLPREPLLRACVIGPGIGIALFYWRAPFPEVRFVVPEFLLLFATAAVAVERLGTLMGSGRPLASVSPISASNSSETGSIIFALSLPAVCLATIFMPRLWTGVFPLVASAVVIAAAALAVFWKLRRWTHQRRIMLIGSVLGLSLFAFAYVYWTAYCRDYRELQHADGSGYAVEYPMQESLWRFVNEHVPADAAVAYTNLYLTYPLWGFDLQRRLIYVPGRAGMRTMSDLPWLGTKLSGEKLVPNALRATVALANRTVWLANLKASGARYLIVGRGGAVNEPPEAAFAKNDPQFHLMFEGRIGRVYLIDGQPQKKSQIAEHPM